MLSLAFRASCECRFIVGNDVGQEIITKRTIESQSAPKLLILPGKCSVGD